MTSRLVDSSSPMSFSAMSCFCIPPPAPPPTTAIRPCCIDSEGSSKCQCIHCICTYTVPRACDALRPSAQAELFLRVSEGLSCSRSFVRCPLIFFFLPTSTWLNVSSAGRNKPFSEPGIMLANRELIGVVNKLLSCRDFQPTARVRREGPPKKIDKTLRSQYC